MLLLVTNLAAVTAPAPQKVSLAVLPFVNRSADGANEFFCDGITEEIINALAGIEQLKVISRTSSFFFKNFEGPLSEIGDQLHVSVVLEGSVRFHGDQLRISAQLINVADDSHFWSETWDRKLENIFDTQDEISRLIAEKLREHWGHLDVADRLVTAKTSSLGAYERYLQGQYLFNQWNPESANQAIAQFEQALAQDAGLIEAHLGMADSYSFLAVAGFAPREEAWRKAQEHIKKAVALDANHAGLNYMLANDAFFTRASYQEAMQYGQRSLAAKPNYAEAQRFMAFLYILRGDMSVAHRHLQYAKSIDPLNPETRFYEAYYYYLAGEYTLAKQILKELLAANEKNVPALVTTLYVLLSARQWQEAAAFLEGIPAELMTPDERLGMECLLMALETSTPPAGLAQLTQHAEAPEAHHAHTYLFLVQVVLGRFDAAFAVLDKLFTVQSSVLLLSFSYPLAEPLRADARYAEYHRRIYALEPAPAQKPAKPKATGLETAKAQAYAETLKRYVAQEKPYLDPTLSLRALAHQIEIHPNQLSWLLNEYLQQNFNEFINHRRIEHFKQLVVDPANAHISLVGLAFESGFNSKTVFNTAFKKKEGITPKAYQKGQLSAGEQGEQ
ncbi:MAG TPA: adenylate cyclase [Cytophagales bacterium]|nr:adenylate cyclase [Cytophagales bacterium]